MKAVGLFTVKLTTSKTVATYVYRAEKHFLANISSAISTLLFTSSFSMNNERMMVLMIVVTD